MRVGSPVSLSLARAHARENRTLVALAAVSLRPPLPIADLGRPMRFYNMFRVFIGAGTALELVGQRRRVDQR